jgi:hypothetical protein
VKALAGRIPRCFANHQTPEGAAYREVVRAKLERLGTLPKDARPVLREWGRLAVELDRLGQRLDYVRSMKQPRKAELRRLQSESRKCRVQLLMYERRLDELAAATKPEGTRDLSHLLTPSLART